MENRKESMNPVVGGLEEQPEELGDDFSTRSGDEEKAFASEILSDLMEGVRVGQLGADIAGRVESSPDSM